MEERHFEIVVWLFLFGRGTRAGGRHDRSISLVAPTQRGMGGGWACGVRATAARSIHIKTTTTLITVPCPLKRGGWVGGGNIQLNCSTRFLAVSLIADAPRPGFACGGRGLERFLSVCVLCVVQNTQLCTIAVTDNDRNDTYPTRTYVHFTGPEGTIGVAQTWDPQQSRSRHTSAWVLWFPAALPLLRMGLAHVPMPPRPISSLPSADWAERRHLVKKSQMKAHLLTPSISRSAG